MAAFWNQRARDDHKTINSRRITKVPFTATNKTIFHPRASGPNKKELL